MSQDWGLVFDMDGVLADTEPYSMRVTQEVLRRLHGVEVPPEDVLAFTGSTALAHYTFLADKYAPGADVQALIDADNRLILELLEQAKNLALEGAEALYAEAASDPACRLAIATGSGRIRSEATLAACGLPTDPIEAWLTGDDITGAKPHPEIYLRSAKTLGLAPVRCVAVEDSIAGVASAKAAGMACLAVTNTFPAEELSAADRIVTTLKDATLDDLRDLLPGV